MNNVGRGQKSTPVIATTGETSKYCPTLTKLNNYINIINNIIKQFTSKLTLLHTIQPWLQIRAIKLKNSVTFSTKAQTLFRTITQFVHINQVFYVPVTYNKRLLVWKRAGNFSLYLISLCWGIFLLPNTLQKFHHPDHWCNVLLLTVVICQQWIKNKSKYQCKLMSYLMKSLFFFLEPGGWAPGDESKCLSLIIYFLITFFLLRTRICPP